MGVERGGGREGEKKKTTNRLGPETNIRYMLTSGAGRGREVLRGGADGDGRRREMEGMTVEGRESGRREEPERGTEK